MLFRISGSSLKNLIICNNSGFHLSVFAILNLLGCSWTLLFFKMGAIGFHSTSLNIYQHNAVKHPKNAKTPVINLSFGKCVIVFRVNAVCSRVCSYACAVRN
jgi:hypothetical protein